MKAVQDHSRVKILDLTSTVRKLQDDLDEALFYITNLEETVHKQAREIRFLRGKPDGQTEESETAGRSGADNPITGETAEAAGGASEVQNPRDEAGNVGSP